MLTLLYAFATVVFAALMLLAEVTARPRNVAEQTCMQIRPRSEPGSTPTHGASPRERTTRPKQAIWLALQIKFAKFTIRVARRIHNYLSNIYLNPAGAG